MDNPDFSHLAVEFFTDAEYDKRSSLEQGRPIFRDVEKVKIRIAGDKQSVLVAPAHDASSIRDPMTNARLTYAQLHHGPYEAFKRGQAYHGTGTPLSELPFIPKSKRKELEAANVYTAEAFIALDGSNLQKLGMGARELRNQVEAYIKKATGSADVVKLAGENEALRLKMEKMQSQIAALMSGSAPKEEPLATAEEYDVSKSPFADWDDDTISLWIVEQGGDKPHHKCSHETLVAKADELNSAIAARNKAA